MLDRLDRLPGPQRDAFAEERPLVCVVDDAQWQEQVEAQTIGFVARRLLAESVGLVFAVREPSEGREVAGGARAALWDPEAGEPSRMDRQ